MTDKKTPEIPMTEHDAMVQASSSWEGEAGKSDYEEFVPSDHVELPVGVLKDGTNYRNFVIDEMSGVDDHLVAKKSENNGSKAMSLVICRSVQEVEGLLGRKRDSEKMFDRELARAMTQPDRDFLITRIFMLSGRDETVLAGECPRCGRINEKPVKLSELPVIRWDEDKPRELAFELEVGVEEKVKGKPSVFHKNGTIRFPTGKEQELTGKMSNPAEIFDAMFAACAKIEGIGTLDTSMAIKLKRRDRDILTDVMKYGLPGICQWEDFECQCGNLMEIRLDLASFFVGRRRKGKK